MNVIFRYSQFLLSFSNWFIYMCKKTNIDIIPVIFSIDLEAQKCIMFKNGKNKM